MYDIAGARSAGLGDDYLVSHLEQSGRIPYDFARARKDGVSSKDILDAIDERQQQQAPQRQQGQPTAPQSSGVVPGLLQGGADVLSGTGETLEQFTPLKSTGQLLKHAAAKIAPANYQRAPLVDEKGFNAQNIPQTAAEVAPGAAAGIAAARLLAKRFGILGGIAGGAGSYALSQLGNRANERAAERTGEEGAAPTLGDKATAAGFMLPEAAIGGLGATRFLPGAGRIANVGMKGVAEAGGQLARTAAVEGGVGGAQNVIAQTGRKIGTEGGVSIDPTEAANAAATGATMAPVFGGGKFARDVNTSVKYRDQDPAVAKRVANDIATQSEHGADSLSSPGAGYSAVKDVTTNYKTDLTSSVNALRREMGTRPFPGEAEGVVKRASAGLALTPRDLNILENTTAGTTSGPAVVEMARKINALARFKKTGEFNDKSQQFVGGMGRAMERQLPVLGQPVKGAAYAGLGAIGASHAGLLIPGVNALAGLAGTYVGARLLDKAMGTRSPAKSFVDRFAGPVPPGSTPAIPGAFQPTGPRIRQPRPMAQPWGSPAAPMVPPAGAPNLPALAPQFNQGPAAQAAPSGVINQPGPAPQPMLGGPNGPSSPFPPPPGRGPIPQPAPNMLMLGQRGPGDAIMQPPPGAQRMLPPPARAQLPDVANRSAYEPEVRALLASANARAKSKENIQRGAEGYMQRMLSEQVPVDISEPAAVSQNKPTPAPKAPAGKVVGGQILLRITNDHTGGASERAAYTITKLNKDGSGEAHNPVSGTWQVSAETMKKAELVESPKSSPVPAAVRAKAKATRSKTTPAPAAPPPSSAAEVTTPSPTVDTTPKPTLGSVKVAESGVVQLQKTRNASPLAARIASQHNADVTRKPVEQSAPTKPNSKLSMAEQLNEEAIHTAIRNGAKSAKEVVAVGEDHEDRQSLRNTLNRMIAEGAIAFNEKKASTVPAAVRAKVKAAKPAVAPQERIEAAAITLKDGRVFTGHSHLEAMDNASQALGKRSIIDQVQPTDTGMGGFKTSSGRVVDRAEAARIAEASKQGKAKDQSFLKAEELPELANRVPSKPTIVVPFKRPEPSGDAYEIPGFLRRTDKPSPPAVPAAVVATRAKAKVEDLDAERRARMAKDKEKAEQGRAVLAKVTTQEAPKPHAAAVEDPWAIPDALRRSKTPEPEKKMPMVQAMAEAPKVSEAEGPPKSPHYKKGDVDGTVKSAQDDFAKAKGHVLNEQTIAKAHSTIDRIIREKHATGAAIAKEIPGFDVHDFTDRFVHTRSYAGGNLLREYMKAIYKGHDDVFDRHMNATTFPTIYTVKKSAADGTAKKR